MRIAYTNEIDSADSITSSTYLSGYSVSNVQNQRLGVEWKSDTTTAQTVTIGFNSSTSNPIKTAAIIGHNITTACTVTLQANQTDAWGAPSLSTAMTVLDDNALILTFFASAQNYKFWRFSFSGQASLEIGRLWLSSYIDVDPSSTLGFTVTKRRSDNVGHGKNRQKYATIGNGWRAINLSFPRTGGTALNNILTMYEAVGRHSSFIFCNFDSIRTYPIVEPMYSSISNDLGFTHTRYMKFEYSLQIEEEL